MDVPVDSKYYDHNYYINDNDGHREFKNGLSLKMHEKFKRFFEILDPQRGQKILDVGCGRGEIAFYAAQKGCRVFCVDYSSAAIDIAKNKIKELPADKKELINFECADITSVEIKETFDFIVLIDVLEHLTPFQSDKLFKKLGKILSENGKIFISTPNGFYEKFFYNLKHIIQYPWKPFKVLGRILTRKYKPNSFKELIEKVFRIIPKKDDKLKIMHVNVMTPWGLKKLMQKYKLVFSFYSGENCFDREIIAVGSLTIDNIIEII